MSRTIPEAVALVKESATLAYTEALASAKKLAEEQPGNVGGVSLAYDVAFELSQLLYYADDDITPARLIAAVAASDADAAAISRYLLDWAEGYVCDCYDRIADERVPALRDLALS